MKKLLLTLPFLLAACADGFPQVMQDAVSRNAREVNVSGRTWTVRQDRRDPATWSAIRDLNNYQLFGKPVALLAPQAVKAIELGSNCKVQQPTLRQDVNARFYAKVTCPTT